MVTLEGADNIVRPGSDKADSTQANGARDYAQGVKRTRNGKDTQAKLGLHHKNDRPKEPNLSIRQILVGCYVHVYVGMHTLR